MGFLAVLAASLFAVFIFTVFGGYSLLLWCQQSLWMVVPPALVLAVLVCHHPKQLLPYCFSAPLYLWQAVNAYLAFFRSFCSAVRIYR